MSIVIVGAGDVGFSLAEKLSSEKKDVLVIEQDERKVHRLTDEVDCQVITGSGSDPAVLKEADIEHAELFIAVTDCDEVNITSCVLAGLQSAVPVKIARVRHPHLTDPASQSAYHLDKLGIDMIINPEQEAADAILNVLSVPGAVEILDFLDHRVRLIGTHVTERCKILGVPFSNLSKLRDELHLLVGAIFRDNELIVPKGEDVLRVGDLIYFVTEPEMVPKAMEQLGYGGGTLRRVMINGGDHIGLYLAKRLEEEGVSVKIIESDPARCSVLIRNLDKAVVLNGVATDQDLLVQENIKDMDAFVAVTDDDENNILSTLLAKRLGSSWNVTLADQTAYVPLVAAIGIDVVINPRMLAVSAILHYVRRGKVLSVASLREEVELIEVEALESSHLVDKKLSNIKWPSRSLVLAIQRGDEIIIPKGETVVKPHDKVLIFAARDVVSKIEKMLTVQLEYF